MKEHFVSNKGITKSEILFIGFGFVLLKKQMFVTKSSKSYFGLYL